jgi:hypothetical protein
MDPATSYPPATPTGPKSTSPWVYVGCTCGVLVALALLAFAGLTWFTYRTAKNVQEGFAGPWKWTERARAVLPWETLPEGYQPLGSFSIPFLVDMAFFSTAPPEGEQASPEATEATAEAMEPAAAEPPAEATTPETPETTEPFTPETTVTTDIDVDTPDLDFGERGLIYLVVRHMDKGREDLDRYLRGEGPPPDWMDKGNVNVESEEVIGNGKVTAGGTELIYSARRGTVTTDNDRREGLYNFFLATCPGDTRTRIGIWFAPDPQPETPAAEADWTGTPADPEALKEFGGHFRFCEGPK